MVLFSLVDPRRGVKRAAGVFAVAAVRMVPRLDRALGTAASMRAGAVVWRSSPGSSMRSGRDAPPAPGVRGACHRETWSSRTSASPTRMPGARAGVSARVATGTARGVRGGLRSREVHPLDVVLASSRPTSGEVTCGGRHSRSPAQWHSQIGGAAGRLPHG
ncbi:hypothetical protein QJS66_07670 [Kocuria rhizophila]|nr:hypothetical protein QJS66_07670 [Kocuria rhizophila]